MLSRLTLDSNVEDLGDVKTRERTKVEDIYHPGKGGSLLHFYLHKDTHLHFGTSDHNDTCIALQIIIMIQKLFIPKLISNEQFFHNHLSARYY
jgi:hypothetical protein